MATQTREQGRYLGGRPPYGYRLADAGPHPNKAHAAWDRRAHRLEPDPATAPVVAWVFAQRLAGHSAARITRALNDAGIPCPSAADPKRNPHRSGTAWTLRTVATILANPRYTGRQVWNRQRTDHDLVDPGNTALGHRQVQRWNLPDGWVISRHPAHPALVSEADFIAAQDATAPRGPGGSAARRYSLAGLLACGRCGRRLESAWSNGKPAYRCRHGYTSANHPEPGRPKNTYVREEQILPHLAAVAILLGRRGAVRWRRADHGSGWDRGPDRQAAGRGHHPDLRPGHPDPPHRRQQHRGSRRRPGPLTPSQQHGKGGREPAKAPAAAEGRARMTLLPAWKQQHMGI
jgi:site-specific DNA recombinase